MVDGDFLTIGQRGTALSEPFLDCNTLDCSDFAASADLTAYNSAYNADDIDDLRKALGYEKMNPYGISYGSRLGLEVLRRHGDNVRAAVIEGLVPSQIVWPAAVPASFYSALTGLDASCGAVAACASAFGNLETKFGTAVNALNTQPVQITIGGGTFDLDGYTFASVLFRALYAKSTYRWLPIVISDLAIRRTDRIGQFFEMFGGGGGSGISTGLYYGVVCGELFNPPDLNAPTQANMGVPANIVEIFGGSFESMVSVCGEWPKHNLAAQMKQPVASNVRTFVSSGRLDPITPPSFGTVAFGSLTNAFHVIHENSGHGATLQSTCGNQNLYNFLANPTATQNTSCAATITTDYVLPTAFASTPIDLALARAELGLVFVPPMIDKRIRDAFRPN
jgi:pimeloyl-ACP methyl ester carboxylesterase